MYTALATPTRNARANTLVTIIGDAPTIKIYTGPPPANPQTAPSGTLLATLTGGTPFGTVSNGVITAGPIPQTSAVANGTAGCFRVSNSTATVIDGDVTDTAGTGALKLDNVSISVNSVVQVSSFVMTEA